MNMLDLIPGLSGADVITLMAAAAAGFAVYAVWSALLVRDPMMRRIKNVGHHRNELREAMLTTQGNRARRRETTVDFMRRVANRLKLLKSQQAEAITPAPCTGRVPVEGCLDHLHVRETCSAVRAGAGWRLCWSMSRAYGR